jgi:hypothetical protein
MQSEENRSKTQAKVISDRWRKLSKEEKQPFEEQSNLDRERFDREVSLWSKANGGMSLSDPMVADLFGLGTRA